jgi:hypothetical protein
LQQMPLGLMITTSRFQMAIFRIFRLKRVVNDMSISDSGMIDANECNCMGMQ